MAVIDKDDRIRLMHYADLPSDIPTDEEVLTLLDRLNNEIDITENKSTSV
jgi:hypothetical protein